MLCGDDLFSGGVFCDFAWLGTIVMRYDGWNYLSRVELCGNLVDVPQSFVAEIVSSVMIKS